VDEIGSECRKRIKLRIIESKAKRNSAFLYRGLLRSEAVQSVRRDERPLSAEHKQLLVRHDWPEQLTFFILYAARARFL